MGWADCGKDQFGRNIGYGFSGKCDQKGCNKILSRGLSNVCGDMHGGGEFGCGMYFCWDHLYLSEQDLPTGFLCQKCYDQLDIDNCEP